MNDEMDQAHRKAYARQMACEQAVVALRAVLGEVPETHRLHRIVTETIEALQEESAHIVAVWD